MTIYDLEIKTATLKKLPSVNLSIEICLYICEQIVKYFSTTCCGDYPGQPKEIVDQVIALQWHLKILVRTLNESVIDHTFEVHRIYTEQKIKSVATVHAIKRMFTLVTLSSVDSRVLLQLLTQLLNSNLQLIQTVLPHSSNKLFDVCAQKTDELLWNLTVVLLKGAASLDHGQLSDLDSARIILELRDGISQITIL